MNKIWNAARFALPYLDGVKGAVSTEEVKSWSLTDRWILSRLHSTIRDVREAVETYRFNDAAQALYQFTWREFCDWYIEETKLPLAGDDPEAARRAALILRHVLDTLLRLLHPFIPFITEELASRIPNNGETIMRGPFPAFDESAVNEEAEREMGLLMDLISAVRNIRAEMNLPPSQRLPLVVVPSTREELELVDTNRATVIDMARITELQLDDPGTDKEPPRNSATAVVGNMRAFVPLDGIVDPDAEIARLEKELAKIEKDLSAAQKKLSNENFLSKAKPEAVEKQQKKSADLSAKSIGLKESLERMNKLKEA
jgi:valyl-tRNA synthetase